MGDSSQGVDRNPAESPPQIKATPPRSQRSRWREPPRLKLLKSLRGEGVLVWSGGSIPVAYELDVFGNGDHRTASGHLEGDFAALNTEDEATPLPAARLRLDGGREIEIDLSSADVSSAEFDAKPQASDATDASWP
ncbi:MAG TPA: hypothetical protein VFW47_07140 [Phenylobacterium sp.]|nr:hypothetical protein [Phenylobacterium sp.]